MHPLLANKEYNHYAKIEKTLNPNAKRNKHITSVILFLVSEGARVNEKDKYGLTPLHYAAMRGNEEATMELLGCCDEVDIEAKDEQLLTPLHLACSYGQVETARMLLESGADIRSSGERKQNALHKSCAVGNITLVQMITYTAEQVYRVFQRMCQMDIGV